MKYLKYFETEAEYTAYLQSEDFILPNVSYVVENNIVNYNPYAEVQENRLVCTVNVTNTTIATKVCNKNSYFTSMEVDGVLQDSVTTGYTFDVVGEHTVKFELADPTSIGEIAFNNCFNLTSIVIPDSVTSIEGYAFCNCTNLTSVRIGSGVTSIGDYAFAFCYDLTSITIPDSVTSIGDSAFDNCTGLSEITCNAITAPSIQSYTFNGVKENGILKVPAGSDYSSWMSTGDYYLGKYNWTIDYI